MILVNIIGDIVDSMRSTGTITLVVPDSTTTTLTSVNSLSAYGWVTIEGTDYRVASATSTSFVIEGVITEATSWKALAPYYEYGHPKEISNILLDRDKNETYKYQKYPLIAFYTDVRVKHGDPFIYGQSERQFISIIGQSDKDYSSKQRYANVIIPILIPLYNTLIKRIQRSLYFTETYPELKHDEVRRPFWGSTSKYGNVKNIFNDPLDSIDMENVSLKLRSGIKC
jgi:hypothetical protein